MVSVIIPNYNHAPYLKRRIDSILNQTYSDFEIILLDDCSSDNSKDILLSYKNHPKVSQIIINKNNSGSPFLQWNKGFELAKGEFLWIAESDDWCESTLLETLIKPLKEDDSLVLSFCQSLLLTENGNIIYKTENKLLEEKLSGRDFVASSMFGDTVLVNAGMAVFRKSSLNQIDNQYKLMRGAGDWMFWVQIALKGNVFISGKYLNYCFRHSATVTASSESSGQDMEEGNIVFQYVLDNANPSLQEIKKALQQRVDIYCNQKNKYTSPEIQKKSLKRLLSLHYDMKNIYRKTRVKKFVQKVFNVMLKALN